MAPRARSCPTCHSINPTTVQGGCCDAWHGVDLPTAPHCDASVLHAPGECRYCDERPDWQRYRQVAGIMFTGRPVSPGDRFSVPCPSDFKRGLAGAHVWPGNQPD